VAQSFLRGHFQKKGKGGETDLALRTSRACRVVLKLFIWCAGEKKGGGVLKRERILWRREEGKHGGPGTMLEGWGLGEKACAHELKISGGVLPVGFQSSDILAPKRVTNSKEKHVEGGRGS